MLKYSEKYFDEKSIDDVKTIIMVYEYWIYYRPYEPYNLPSSNSVKTRSNSVKTNSNSVKMNSNSVKIYGKILIYYDVDKQECIGHDRIGPQTTIRTGTDEIRAREDYVIDKIESRVKKY